jgi:hypothetical protein
MVILELDPADEPPQPCAVVVIAAGVGSCCLHIVARLLVLFKSWMLNQGIVKEFILLPLVAGQNSVESCLI